MEEITAKDVHEEDLSLREELSKELSSREVLLIVIPFVFNLLIPGVSGYFEKYINQFVLLFLAMTVLWAILFFLEKKRMAQFKLKILLQAIGFYILVISAFNWIRFTFFDSEKVSDDISLQFLIIFVNAVSFFLVWLGFQFLQKINKN